MTVESTYLLSGGEGDRVISILLASLMNVSHHQCFVYIYI